MRSKTDIHRRQILHHITRRQALGIELASALTNSPRRRTCLGVDEFAFSSASASANVPWLDDEFAGLAFSLLGVFRLGLDELASASTNLPRRLACLGDELALTMSLPRLRAGLGLDELAPSASQPQRRTCLGVEFAGFALVPSLPRRRACLGVELASASSLPHPINHDIRDTILLRMLLKISMRRR